MGPKLLDQYIVLNSKTYFFFLTLTWLYTYIITHILILNTTKRHTKRMSSISNRPLTFSESDKFDDWNWITFETMVTIMVKVQEAIGYLEETIYNLTTTSDNFFH